jgi:biopolymer transport protein ExbB
MFFSQRRYRNSTRIALFAIMMAAIGITAGTVFAQTNGTIPTGGEQPEGLTHLIMGHIDGIFITIAALSVTGLTLIIQGFIQNRPSVVMPEETTNRLREMISQKNFKELIDFTETDDSFVSKALNAALKRAPLFSAMKEAMETSIGEQTAEQFRKIEYLNIIGNLGPLLGLLGTVLGMIQAFSAMQAAKGDANPAQLAGGISTALTHTFLGLFLAIPCLAAFGVLRTIVDRLTVRASLVAEELLLMIRPTETRPAAPGTTTARAAAIPQPGVRKLAPLPSPAPMPVPGPAPAST